MLGKILFYTYDLCRLCPFFMYFVLESPSIIINNNTIAIYLLLVILLIINNTIAIYLLLVILLLINNTIAIYPPVGYSSYY